MQVDRMNLNSRTKTNQKKKKRAEVVVHTETNREGTEEGKEKMLVCNQNEYG